MQKNTFMFVLCSTVFLLVWFMFFQPKQNEQQIQLQQQQQTVSQQQENNNQELNIQKQETVSLPFILSS